MKEQSLRQFVFNGLLLYDSLEALRVPDWLRRTAPTMTKARRTQAISFAFGALLGAAVIVGAAVGAAGSSGSACSSLWGLRRNPQWPQNAASLGISFPQMGHFTAYFLPK